MFCATIFTLLSSARLDGPTRENLFWKNSQKMNSHIGPPTALRAAPEEKSVKSVVQSGSTKHATSPFYSSLRLAICRAVHHVNHSNRPRVTFRSARENSLLSSKFTDRDIFSNLHLLGESRERARERKSENPMTHRSRSRRHFYLLRNYRDDCR